MARTGESSHRRRKRLELTTNDDPKQNTNDKVPNGHGDHDTNDRDVLHPSQMPHHKNQLQNYRLCDAHLLTRCLVSHNASFTRSIPRTKMSAPTTMIARWATGPLKVYQRTPGKDSRIYAIAQVPIIKSKNVTTASINPAIRFPPPTR